MHVGDEFIYTARTPLRSLFGDPYFGNHRELHRGHHVAFVRNAATDASRVIVTVPGKTGPGNPNPWTRPLWTVPRAALRPTVPTVVPTGAWGEAARGLRRPSLSVAPCKLPAEPTIPDFREAAGLLGYSEREVDALVRIAQRLAREDA